MRIVPAAAKLNKRNARKSMGYSVLNVDRSLYTKFTRDGVEEIRPGFYVAKDGIQVPDGGGYIVWGLKTRVIIEDSFEPVEQVLPNLSPRVAELSQMVDSRFSAAEKSTFRAISSVLDAIRSIDLSTPIEESQQAIMGVMEGSGREARLILESITEQIDNRLKLNSDNLRILESLVGRMEANENDEMALGNQITDILRGVGEARESSQEALGRLGLLEQAIRTNVDIDATIEEQKVLITEFFDLMGAE